VPAPALALAANQAAAATVLPAARSLRSRRYLRQPKP